MRRHMHFHNEFGQLARSLARQRLGIEEPWRAAIAQCSIHIFLRNELNQIVLVLIHVVDVQPLVWH